MPTEGKPSRNLFAEISEGFAELREGRRTMPTRNKNNAAANRKRQKAVKASDLWLEFLGPDTPYAFHGTPMQNCHCGLCGNSGIIDTRFTLVTPAGQPCGVRRFCICPNGRKMKKGFSGALVPPERD